MSDSSVSERGCRAAVFPTSVTVSGPQQDGQYYDGITLQSSDHYNYYMRICPEHARMLLGTEDISRRSCLKVVLHLKIASHGSDNFSIVIRDSILGLRCN